MVVGYAKSESLTATQKFIAGVVSGVTTRFLSQPLDILKVRTQLQGKRTAKTKARSALGLALSIFKEEGVTAFWHGHCLGQLHSILSVSTQFHAYEMSTKFVEHTANAEMKPIMLFVCGIFAGCVSATLASPLEVIRVRQMIVKAQYGGLWQGSLTVYRNGGIGAFFEGLPAALMQMGPQVGITFAVFRIVQPRILEFMVPSHNETDDIETAVVKNHMVGMTHLFVASTIAGSVAGFVAKTMTYPFDLAKRRLQIASHRKDPTVATPSTSRDLIRCKTLLSCFVDMYRKGGLRGLFRGWSITIYKAQVNSVIAFTSYELSCHLIREHSPDH